MAELPLDEAVARFKSNEERVRQFVNAMDGEEFYVTESGEQVPVLPKLLPAVTAKTEEANTAANRAEAAEGNAFVNAVVFESVEAGRAAVIDGDQFQVLSEDGREYVRYRRDSDSVSPEVARYPAASSLDLLKRTNFSIFAVEDDDGNLGLSIESPFQVDAGGGIETSEFKQAPGSTKWIWALADTDGNVVAGIDHLGRLVANLSSIAPVADNFKVGGTYDYSLNHIFCYGQSLSVGQALPVQSATPKYDTLMFTRGLRPQYDYPAEGPEEWYAGLVPAVEAVSPVNATLGETPSRGAADMVKQLIQDEDGKAFTDHEYKLLVSAPGYGGLRISQLSKGTLHFSRMVEQAEYGRALANAQGYTYAVQAVTWIQGESDYLSGTTGETYLGLLNTLVADIQTDLKAASGQGKRIVVIGGQVASHIHGAEDDVPDISLAQSECARTNPNFYIATPMYHLPYADGFHLTGVGSLWLAAYLGLAEKRIVIDKEEWRTVQPIDSALQGNILEIRFHVPRGRLVFDTTSVPAQPNYGFQLVSNAGLPLVISTIEIVDRDRLRFIAPTSIPADGRMRYAWQGDSARGLGNLRDTQGDTIVFDPEGLAKPLHNFCEIFEWRL